MIWNLLIVSGLMVPGCWGWATTAMGVGAACAGGAGCVEDRAEAGCMLTRPPECATGGVGPWIRPDPIWEPGSDPS